MERQREYNRDNIIVKINVKRLSRTKCVNIDVYGKYKYTKEWTKNIPDEYFPRNLSGAYICFGTIFISIMQIGITAKASNKLIR